MTKENNNLEQLAKQWLDMPVNSALQQQVAERFYDENIFPLVKRSFVERESGKARQYDYLILPVGTSPEPLILAILTLKPKKVLFLHTKETEEDIDTITAATNLKPSEEDKVKIDGSNVLDIYHHVKEAYEKWGQPKSIAVDITGGKKSMVSGAALAGAFIGADIYYVDNTRFITTPREGSLNAALIWRRFCFTGFWR